MHTLSRVLLEQNFLKPVQPSLGYELQHQGSSRSLQSTRQKQLKERVIKVLYSDKDHTASPS
jgi:hypothetical protein